MGADGGEGPPGRDHPRTTKQLANTTGALRGRAPVVLAVRLMRLPVQPRRLPHSFGATA